MKDIIRKLTCGSRQTSRLADEKGNRIPAWRLCRNGPKAFCSFACRKLFNIRPQVPWISYDARHLIGRLLPRRAAILEFGSGNSTLWYARHFGAVDSVEHDPKWHSVVSKTLRERGLSNVRCYLHTEETYPAFPETAGRQYDCIMIDGIRRSACALTAVQKIKSDGIIYLDNSDKHPTGGDTRLAEDCLVSFGKQQSARILYFTDFAPTDLFGNQGMMVLLGRYATEQSSLCYR
jgi:Methyltransferase domain